MAIKLQKPEDPEITQPLKDWLDKIDKYMIGVIIVVGFGFLTLLVTVSGLVIDAYRFKASSYQALVDKVNSTNDLLQVETQNKDEARLLNIQAQIDTLHQKNPYLK